MASLAGGETMRAVVRDRYASVEVLRVARVARPAAGVYEVLVQVRSAGLDRGTCQLMAGRPDAVASAIQRPWPGPPRSAWRAPRGVAGEPEQAAATWREALAIMTEISHPDTDAVAAKLAGQGAGA